MESRSRNTSRSKSKTQSDFDMFVEDAKHGEVRLVDMTMGEEALGRSSSVSEERERGQWDQHDGENENAHEQEQERDNSFARSTSSSSAGELDTSFKFGGLPMSLRKEAAGGKAPVQMKAKAKNDGREEWEREDAEWERERERAPMTLSDVIPPPAHARRLSQSLDSSGFSDNALFEDIYAQLMHPASVHLAAAVAPAPTNGQKEKGQDKEREREAKRRSVYTGPSRPTSGISFTGMGDSFEAVRRAFEFNNERPAFYPPPSRGRSGSGGGSSSSARHSQPRHNKMASTVTVASMSSFGSVKVHGVSDPFEYGVPVMPRLSERPSDENMSAAFFSGSECDDTFAFRRAAAHPPQPPGSLRYFGAPYERRRVESDASTFSFHAPVLPTAAAAAVRGHHRRRESNMSVASLAPPISLYNRSHRRNDSTASTGSVAYASRAINNNGAHAYARHRRDMSDASMGSEFSAGYSYLGRPGVGDKMFGDRERYERPGVGDKMFFENRGGGAGMELGPLTSITASPPESAVRRSFAFSSADGESAYGASSESGEGEEVPLQSYSSSSMLAYDSIMSGGARALDDSDSLFEKTGYEVQRDSVESDELFGGGFAERDGQRLNAPVIKSHRWSVHTTDNTGVFGSDNTGAVSPGKINEEDTMLSVSRFMVIGLLYSGG